MKTTYTQPLTAMALIGTATGIFGVSSGNGIGYGGVYTDRSKAPPPRAAATVMNRTKRAKCEKNVEINGRCG